MPIHDIRHVPRTEAAIRKYVEAPERQYTQVTRKKVDTQSIQDIQRSIKGLRAMQSRLPSHSAAYRILQKRIDILERRYKKYQQTPPTKTFKEYVPTHPKKVSTPYEMSSQILLIEKRIEDIKKAPVDTTFTVEDKTVSKTEAIQHLRKSEQNLTQYKNKIDTYIDKLRKKGFKVTIKEDGQLIIVKPEDMSTAEAMYLRIALAPDDFEFTITDEKGELKVVGKTEALKISKEQYERVVAGKAQQIYTQAHPLNVFGLIEMGLLREEVSGTLLREFKEKVEWKWAELSGANKETIEKEMEEAYQAQMSRYEAQAGVLTEFKKVEAEGTSQAYLNYFLPEIIFAASVATSYGIGRISAAVTPYVQAKMAAKGITKIAGMKPSTILKIGTTALMATTLAPVVYSSVNAIYFGREQIEKVKKDFSESIRKATSEAEKRELEEKRDFEIEEYERLVWSGIGTLFTTTFHYMAMFAAGVAGFKHGLKPKVEVIATKVKGIKTLEFQKYSFGIGKKPFLRYGPKFKFYKPPTGVTPIKGTEVVPYVPRGLKTISFAEISHYKPMTWEYPLQAKKVWYKSITKQPLLGVGKQYWLSTKVWPRPTIWEPELKYMAPLESGVPSFIPHIRVVTKPVPKIFTMKDLIKKGVIPKEDRGGLIQQAQRQQTVLLQKKKVKAVVKLKKKRKVSFMPTSMLTGKVYKSIEALPTTKVLKGVKTLKTVKALKTTKKLKTVKNLSDLVSKQKKKVKSILQQILLLQQAQKQVSKQEYQQSLQQEQLLKQDLRQEQERLSVLLTLLSQAKVHEQRQAQAVGFVPALLPKKQYKVAFKYGIPKLYKPRRAVGFRFPKPTVPRPTVPKLVILKPPILKKKIKPTISKQGYDTFVKSKGKFIKVNTKPLYKEQADALGAHVTDNTAARTFFIKKTNKPAQPAKTKHTFNKAKFRKPIRKGKPQLKSPKWIEKTTHAIDTQGEFEGITVKGWLARRKGLSKRQKQAFKTFKPFVGIKPLEVMK